MQVNNFNKEEAQILLDSVHTCIGGGELKCTDEVLEIINKLESYLEPVVEYNQSDSIYPDTPDDRFELDNGNYVPYSCFCNSDPDCDCMDCICLRSGCPEDV